MMTPRRITLINIHACASVLFQVSQRFILVLATVFVGGCWPFVDTSDRPESIGFDSVRIFQATSAAPPSGDASYRPVSDAAPIDAGFEEAVSLRIEIRTSAENMPLGESDLGIDVTVSELNFSSSQVALGSSSAVSRGRVTSLQTFDVVFTVDRRDIDYTATPILFELEAWLSLGPNPRALMTRSSVPVRVRRGVQLPSASLPVQVSSGERHSVMLDSDGEVWAWGANDQFQVDTITQDAAPQPVRIDLPVPVRSISAGAWHTVALSESGQSVWSWGADYPNSGRRPTPIGVSVEDPTAMFGARPLDLSAAYAGIDASYLISADGDLYAWGRNENGRLGLDGSDDQADPRLVPIGSVSKVAVGASHVLALKPDGSVWGWGESRDGQLGIDLRSSDSVILQPTQIAGVSGIVDMAASGDTSYLVTSSGQLLVFGNESSLPTTAAATTTNVRVAAGVDDAIGVAANIFGGSVLIARQRTNGDVYYSAHGANSDGQLGIDPTLFVSGIADVEFPNVDMTSLSVGGGHGLFVQQDSGCAAVWSWGANDSGQLGRPADASNSASTPAPIPLLGAETCALLTVSADNGGEMSSSPGTIDCGADCDNRFATGSSVTLDATVRSASFLGLGGDCRLADGTLDNALPASILMNQHRYCPASFADPSGFIAPVARFVTTPESPVMVGTAMTFDGSSSSDIDGIVVAWSWDLDGDGVEDSAGETVSFTYTTAGMRSVTLTVTDNDGQSGGVTQLIDVSSMLSAPPVAAFTISPGDNLPFGSTFTFDASTSTDDVGIVLYEWDIDGDGNPNVFGPLLMWIPQTEGDLDVRLRVTDADGQFDDAIDTITVQPRPVGNQVTLRMIINGPGQLDIPTVGGPYPDSDCDGDSCFVTVPAGSVLNIDATAFTPAAFQGWSAADCDSTPAINRCVVTMNTDRTVNATFQ